MYPSPPPIILFQLAISSSYPSTLANSTLITLFSEMLKFSKIICSKSKDIVKEINENFKIN